MAGDPQPTSVRVPFVDLGPSHAPIRSDILAAIDDLIGSGAFTNGPAVASFERAFSAYVGTEHAVGVGSGLDALRLALLGLGLERGSEVVVPAMTFAATVEAVVQAGLEPVLADVRVADGNVDPDAVASLVSGRTSALLPVHLYGQMADMRALRPLAEHGRLALLEDACQAHGATRDGLASGAAGDAGAFSFYPGKNLGAMGDAGAVTTSRPALAEAIRALREHGQREKYVHESNGYTARLDTIQALVLERKLAFLDAWNDERRVAAALYEQALDGVGDLALPRAAPGSEPVWHLYVVRTAAPEELGEFLRRRGIASGRHYPFPIHLMPAYRSLGRGAGSFPAAETIARECLSLPIYPGIGELEIAATAQAVQEFFRRGL